MSSSLLLRVGLGIKKRLGILVSLVSLTKTVTGQASNAFRDFLNFRFVILMYPRLPSPDPMY